MLKVRSYGTSSRHETHQISKLLNLLIEKFFTQCITA